MRHDRLWRYIEQERIFSKGTQIKAINAEQRDERCLVHTLCQ
jgi:hypothetical protein